MTLFTKKLDNDVFNEVNEYKRYRLEAQASPETFFNSTGNPFLGFMHFLDRKPVPPKAIDEQKLLQDFSVHASDKRKFSMTSIPIYILAGLFFSVFIFAFISPNLATSLFSLMPIVFFAAIIISLLLMIFRMMASSRHEKESYYTFEDYKSYVVKSALLYDVEELVYEPHFGLPERVFNDLRAIKSGNIYSAEDLITGKYNGVYFAQSDLRIKYRSSSKNHSSTTVYFKGRWIVVSCPKSFSGTVIVADRTQGYVVEHNDFEELELENPYFNDVFRVQSSDMELAYYLITPQLMEKIMEIRNSTLGKVVVCFKNGYIHIGIDDGRDSFEPNIKAPSLYDDIASFQKDFKLVSGIIETLDIDSSVYNISKPSEEKQEYYSNPSSNTASYANSYANSASSTSSDDSGIHIQGNF